jgi:hypothetical protein
VSAVRQQLTLIHEAVNLAESLAPFSEYQRVVLKDLIFDLLTQGNSQQTVEGA